ncbi:coatomer complex beta [Cryptosporidium sp. chipmunk genotype I]|uniref:coatomer complex beta n=1 Tax=Cryptosporidium sp. chipmunk genotype I TaxID=1280935 RepID=UPI003519FF5D|nr:coatomer complex beta [Cryptosporidium sp. chipmunk genotype I]
MPLRLDIKKKLQTSSERVKSIDFHESEPWLLSGLYNGTITVHDYETQSLLKSLEVSEYPIRCAIFVCRKQWIITCGDDLQVRVYNYNTMNKVTSFEAHNDFIRHIMVHNKLPLLLTCSDDMTIKVWDWDRDWIKAQTFQGNSHYVMMIQWNPKDAHVFASVSLDRTVRIWGLQPNICSLVNNTVNTPKYSLTGHEGGINCLAYSPSAEKPYIATGSDDKTVRVWDYQTKQCIQILTGHSKAVRSVIYHNQLPLILSCSEDGTIKIWHSTTYRLECTLNYLLDRCWCLSVCKNILGIGYDEGSVVVKIGSEQPLATLNSGKILIAKGTEICQANLRALAAKSSSGTEWEFEFDDGERVILPYKELGCSEIYPQDIQFHPNGRFLSVCGDGEFVIYTTQALRSKCFGKAIELSWSIDGHFFAIRENGGRIVIYNNFKESVSFLPSFFVDEIFGGQLLGIKSNDFICFYDWNECRLVRRIDVSSPINNVYWDDIGNYVCITCSDTFYLLKYNKQKVEEALSLPIYTSSNDQHTGNANNMHVDNNDGVEIAFDFVSEINDKVESGVWISTCFVYVTSQMRLQIWMNGFIDLVAYLPEKTMYHILGYVKEIHRIMLMSKDFNCVSYSLDLNYIEYQSCIINKDFDTAENVYWGRISPNLHTKIARFLEIQGYKEKALSITDDQDQKFDLALSLGKLELCISILQEMQLKDQYENTNVTIESIATHGQEDIKLAATGEEVVDISSVNRKRWKVLGDIALEKGRFSMAIACYREVQDLDSLLLIYSCIGDIEGLKYVATIASRQNLWNTAFICHTLLQDKESCIEDLIQSDLVPYAAMFARCYYPSKLEEIVLKWREFNKKGEQLLASPSENLELFPFHKESLKLESLLSNQELINRPVESWDKLFQALNSDLIEDFHKNGFNYVKDQIWGGDDINIDDLNNMESRCEQIKNESSITGGRVEAGPTFDHLDEDEEDMSAFSSPRLSDSPEVEFATNAVEEPEIELGAVYGENLDPKARSPVKNNLEQNQKEQHQKNIHKRSSEFSVESSPETHQGSQHNHKYHHQNRKDTHHHLNNNEAQDKNTERHGRRGGRSPSPSFSSSSPSPKPSGRGGRKSGKKVQEAGANATEPSSTGSPEPPSKHKKNSGKKQSKPKD